MEFITWGLIIATVFFILYLRNRSNKPKVLNGKVLKSLPGPKGLPLIGNLLQLTTSPNKQYTKWSQEFGDIFELKLPGTSIIIVSNPKLAKEIFSDPGVMGRPHLPPATEWYPDTPNIGIIMSEGELWEVHRRFLLRQLRDFGFGKSSMEALIMEDVNEIIARFKKQSRSGQPIGNINQALKIAVVNSLWQILTNQKFDHDDPQLIDFIKRISEVLVDMLERGGLYMIFPAIRHILPEISGFNNWVRVIAEKREFFTKIVDDHKKTFDENNLRDFTDVYLAEMKKAENQPNSPFHGEKAERHLKATLSDLFEAGTETTAATLAFGILYMAKFPQVQKKFQNEISEVTGNTRKVSVQDRPAMPYTCAVIEETLRLSSVAPDGVPHRVTEDREFQGYYFPKDTMVQPNTNFINKSPAIWGDPENFRPERFLVEDETKKPKFQKNENMQGFQVGRRQCVGETLARDSVFLYMVNIFQTFDVALNPGEPEPSLEGNVGISQIPQPYTVIMNERNL